MRRAFSSFLISRTGTERAEIENALNLVFWHGNWDADYLLMPLR